MNRLLSLLTLLSCACAPEAEVDKVPDNEPPAGDTGVVDDSVTTAVLATVSDDYSVGALATISLDDWTVTDTITDLTGDPGVVAAGPHIFQLNRYGHDSVRVYTPGSWGAPDSEFALADLANPHDVDLCGEQAVVSQYGVDQLAFVDPNTGLLSGSVDLSAHSDADGIPEASTMVKGHDGRLYVGLHQFRRDEGWATAEGEVVEVDCDSRTVTASWSASVPDVYPWPTRPTELLVFEKDVGIRILDQESGELRGVLVSTDDLGGNVVALAAFGAVALVALSDADQTYAIGCIDLIEGSVVSHEPVDSYIPSLVGDGLGSAWVSMRPHWSNPDAPTGTRVYNISACTERTTTPLQTLLAPVDIAFY